MLKLGTALEASGQVFLNDGEILGLNGMDRTHSTDQQSKVLTLPRNIETAKIGL